MNKQMALYRKYRPKTFDEISGQKQVVEVLKNAIKYNKISHAYIFSGPRGTGKTSTAKIIAKAFNCSTPIEGKTCGNCVSCETLENTDVIELDAASNNGVDEIRTIISHVNFKPNYGNYKVYIIDEVHMLTKGAFNALLKTLEEPPAHVIFILATTELHKIPKTILSRCQRFDFKKITPVQMEKRLTFVCKQEGIDITKEALTEISGMSEGAMRDALSLLEQVSTYKNSEISIEDVNYITGGLSESQMKYFLGNIFLGNIEEVISKIKECEESGKNYIRMCDELIKIIKNELIKKYNYQENIIDKFGRSVNDVFLLIKILQDGFEKIRNSASDVTAFELVIFELLSINIKTETIEKSQKNTITNTTDVNRSIENETVQSCQEEKDEVAAADNMTVENKTIVIAQEKKLEKFETNDCVDKGLPFDNVEVRINNSFIDASKLIKNNYISLISNIPVLENPNLVNIIKTAAIMVASENHILFMCEYNSGAERLNELYLDIENILQKYLNNDVKIVGVSKERWGQILDQYKQKKCGCHIKTEPEINIKKSVDQLEKLFGSDIVELKERGE